jgi:hypothetical protein
MIKKIIEKIISTMLPLSSLLQMIEEIKLELAQLKKDIHATKSKKN